MTAMIRKLTGMVEKARKLESAIAAKVEGAASRVAGAPADRQPLELVHAVVDAVAREIHPVGRGQNGFPFTDIRVAFLAPNARAQALLETILAGPQSLQQRIEGRLRAAGCAVKNLTVQVSFVAEPQADWSEPDHHIECLRIAEAPATTSSAARLEIVVIAGTTGRASYSFGPMAVAIGRGGEICDRRGRLIRTNHIAFTEDEGEINQTVSRLHARIEHDAASGAYRLFDEGSSRGTSVIRRGRGFAVSRTRGMKLASGDEISLGRARLKVKIIR